MGTQDLLGCLDAPAQIARQEGLIYRLQISGQLASK